MLPTLTDEPFSDPGWIFETKWDGYRALCYIRNGNYQLISRNQLDMTARYPELSKLPHCFDAETAVVDGEIVAIGPDGLPSFQLMQGWLSGNRRAAKSVRILYYVFDLIYLDGFDLRACQLVDRKERLEQVFTPANVVKFSDHIETEGKALFKIAANARLEGIVAKERNSHYVEGRTKLW